MIDEARKLARACNDYMAQMKRDHGAKFGGLAALFPLRGSDESGVTLENYAVFFGDWIYAQIFVKSFGVALLTTLACLVMAYPVALLIARSPKRHRDLMVLLCVLPFASNFATKASGNEAELVLVKVTVPKLARAS